MTPPPARPKIYHITHVDNLARIASTGELLSDRLVAESGAAVQVIGMSAIKRRRIDELDVPCHLGTKVGDYVPFYFCPRSVMLYVIHMANHPELTYRGGQEPIVHLEADLQRAIGWANENGRRWAFSLSNAGGYYAQFRARLQDLAELDWNAIAATEFRAPEVKEAKQAEFLVYERFPFDPSSGSVCILARSSGAPWTRLRAQPIGPLSKFGRTGTVEEEARSDDRVQEG